MIAPDATAVRRYLSERAPTAPEVLVITGAEALVQLDEVRLRRRDRVLWLQGWSAGPCGRDLAIAVERAASVGLFGRARHGFSVDG